MYGYRDLYAVAEYNYSLYNSKNKHNPFLKYVEHWRSVVLTNNGTADVVYCS